MPLGPNGVLTLRAPSPAELDSKSEPETATSSDSESTASVEEKKPGNVNCQHVPEMEPGAIGDSGANVQPRVDKESKPGQELAPILLQPMEEKTVRVSQIRRELVIMEPVLRYGVPGVHGLHVLSPVVMVNNLGLEPVVNLVDVSEEPMSKDNAMLEHVQHLNGVTGVNMEHVQSPVDMVSKSELEPVVNQVDVMEEPMSKDNAMLANVHQPMTCLGRNGDLGVSMASVL